MLKLTLTVTLDRGRWEKFCPATNVAWLKYLAEHILVEDWNDSAEQSAEYMRRGMPPCPRHHGNFSDGVTRMCLKRRREDVINLLNLASSASHFVRLARRHTPYLFGLASAVALVLPNTPQGSSIERLDVPSGTESIASLSVGGRSCNHRGRYF